VLDYDLVISAVAIVMLALYGVTPKRELLDRASVKVLAPHIVQA
jgi:hypothetical protein